MEKQHDQLIIGDELFDIQQRLSKLSLSDASVISKRQLIAVANYGFNRCIEIQSVVRKVPSYWSDTIRLKFIQELDTSIDRAQMLAFTSPDSPTAGQEYIGPPIGECVNCERILKIHNKPVKVHFYGLDGRLSYKKKVTLRCTNCKLNYGFDKYGNKAEGYQFYSKARDSVSAKDTVIFERQLINLHCGLAQHSWVSFEGFTESWKDTFNLTKAEAFDRRVYADAFWWAEVENELRETGETFSFFVENDREKCMAMLDKLRQQGLYPHPPEDCHNDCKARGCGKLWITDGIWKTQFAHCMWNMKVSIDNIPLVNLPSVCTNETKQGKAFCDYHCKLCENRQPPIPTGLRDFIRYSGGDDDGLDGEVPAATIPSVNTNAIHGSSCLLEQGGQEFLSAHKSSIPAIDALATKTSESRCSKDLGDRKTLRKMSRGHQFIVRAGGHIDMWTPLYQSESVGQVYLIIIAWLYLMLQDIPSTSWDTMWLAYDNMCQLTKLKATSKPLPLPAPFDSMWHKINKIIDCLHVRNHTDVNCQTILHPDNFCKMYPDLIGTKNTQAGEQTFVWLSRYKKIVCSMPKLHHLFYLHRMVKRRNKYTVKCYAENRKPLLPSLRNSKSN